MRRTRPHVRAVRLNTELLCALEQSAEKSGLPLSTQHMLLLKQALAKTMETKEYAERLEAARRGRTRDDFLNDMQLAAEGIRRDEEARQAEAERAAQAAEGQPTKAPALRGAHPSVPGGADGSGEPGA